MAQGPEKKRKKRMPPRDELEGSAVGLTEEELRELPSSAAVAIAVRCAMRVQPIARPSQFRRSLALATRATHVQSISIALDIANMLASGKVGSADTETLAYAVDQAIVDADADADTNAARAATSASANLVSAYSLTYAHGDNAPYHVAAAVDSARAAAVAVTADAASAADAGARSDYEQLTRSEKGRDADDQRIAVQKLLFNVPLWPNGEPDGWRSRVVTPWLDELKQLALEVNRPELTEIATSYMQMLDGRGFDFEAAERRVEEWMKRRGQKGRAQATSDDEPKKSPPMGAATAVHDEPTAEDQLGRAKLAESLAAIFAAEQQATPFTVALLGDWGSGKSSVMKIALDRLNEWREESDYRKHSPYDFYFAAFNAWEYEHTDSVRAGLAQEVINGLVGPLPWWKKLILKFHFGYCENPWPIIRAVLLLAAVSLAGVWLLWFVAVQEFGERYAWIETLANAGILVSVGTFALFLWQHLKPILDHPLATELTTYLKLPDYGEYLGEVPVMKKHLQSLCELRGVKKDGTHRLIVIVDDLDRCEPKCINETLDAVRLVMDIPNVIVVIAIDHRIAMRAVGWHYRNVADEDRDQFAIARDYLSKIIQLSVMLEDPRDLGGFIRGRLFAQLDDEQQQEVRSQWDVRKRELERATQRPEGITAQASEDARIGRKKKSQTDGVDLTSSFERAAVENEGRPHSGTPDSVVGAAGGATVTPQPETRPTLEERLIIMEERIDDSVLFHQLAHTFDFHNPRQLIRLRNAHRLLCQLTGGQQSRPSTKIPNSREIMVMLFWIECLNGLRAPERNEMKKVLFNNDDSGLEDGRQRIVRETFSIQDKLDRNTYDIIFKQVERFVLPSRPDPGAPINQFSETR